MNASVSIPYRLNVALEPLGNNRFKVKEYQFLIG